MSKVEPFPSDHKLAAPTQATGSKTPSSQANGSKALASQTTGAKAPPSRPSDTAEPRASAHGRRPARSTAHTPSHRRLRSPPPSRQPAPSSLSSYTSASPSFTPIGKWTVAGPAPAPHERRETAGHQQAGATPQTLPFQILYRLTPQLNQMSLAHSTTSCPQVNPAIPACPETAQPKSTSYIPHSATINADQDSKGESNPPFSVAG
ncbi:putative protein TPRXL [Sinocyclocheilus rhinocerous]|uniref:putative protein TPRXL n=1 Tax=Sinocyclocheilus rhinocerous TaxID=307959 RepID=UPI0007B9D9E8|nr:PREDICTED: putative protein TPRXL [Sinocyclocheilus rhinocerous]